ERNIPVSVTVELTRRCPLACRHCYLPETRGRSKPASELSSAQWERIFVQLAEAGALYLVFTGGEPLLRPDLARLCRRAKELKFDVRVFSTGLGLNRERALELKEAGVSGFEISFYGKSVLHDAVTGRNGSFRSSLAAARLLKSAGLAVKIKVPLMKINAGQAGWLQKLAKKEGFEISFDPVITAANDGNKSALPLRLTGPRLATAVKPLSAAPAPRPPAPESHSSIPAPRSPILDFLCGAGRNVCAVGPGGELYSCLQVPVKLGDLTRRKFAAIWKNSAWLKKWRLAGVKDLKGCAACVDIGFCSRCPGVSLLEAGDVFAPNKPACEMAGILRLANVSKVSKIAP
ncbi:MAG: radical SAM protein, partial [Elusimicrobiota bacterium]|nr:radical SAM protein [Elusimicrobiota bacterium]